MDPVGVDTVKPSDCIGSVTDDQRQTWTYHGLCQVLSVHKRVDNGKVGAAPPMQGHFIHNLPTCMWKLHFLVVQARLKPTSRRSIQLMDGAL